MNVTLDLNTLILGLITAGGGLLARRLLAQLDAQGTHVEQIRNDVSQIRVDVAAHGARLDAHETLLSDRR